MSYADAGRGKKETSLDLVKQFHKTFEQPVHDQPKLDDENVNALRLDLLYEELIELRVALDNHDPVATLDALTDLQYVLDGAYLSLGLHRWKMAALAEIQRSNMTKLDMQGLPIKRFDGKILKGPLYEPPDLKKVLNGSGDD